MALGLNLSQCHAGIAGHGQVAAAVGLDAGQSHCLVAVQEGVPPGGLRSQRWHAHVEGVGGGADAGAARESRRASDDIDRSVAIIEQPAARGQLHLRERLYHRHRQIAGRGDVNHTLLNAVGVGRLRRCGRGDPSTGRVVDRDPAASCRQQQRRRGRLEPTLHGVAGRRWVGVETDRHRRVHCDGGRDDVHIFVGCIVPHVL